MPAGRFAPHRSLDPDARVRHIETFIEQLSAEVVTLAQPRAAAKSAGVGHAFGVPASGGGGSGGGGAGRPSALAGDVVGPLGNNVAQTAANGFELLAGDLKVDAGHAFLTFRDAGGGSDSPVLRPTFLTMTHHTVAATVPGVGAAIDWVVADSAVADQTIASLISEVTTPTAGAVDATMGIVVKKGSVDVEVVRFRGAGTGSMAATNVGVTGALKGFTGGQAWFRGNCLFEGLDGNVASITDAGTTSTVIPLTLKHLTSGAAAAGLGVELDFVNQNSSGAPTVTGFLQSLYTGGITGAENGSVIFGAIYGGARVEVARFRATGMPVVGGVGGQFFCRGDFFHAGTNFGIFGKTPTTQPAAYTVTNATPNRSLDEAAATLTQLSQVVGTLLTDLQSIGVVG